MNYKTTLLLAGFYIYIYFYSLTMSWWYWLHFAGGNWSTATQSEAAADFYVPNLINGKTQFFSVFDIKLFSSSETKFLCRQQHLHSPTRTTQFQLQRPEEEAETISSQFWRCGLNDLPKWEIQLQGRTWVPSSPHLPEPEERFHHQFHPLMWTCNMWYKQPPPHSLTHA